MAYTGYTPLLTLLVCAAAATSCRADSIDEFVRSTMHRQHIPGLSLAIVEKGKVVKVKGYGFASLEWKVPATPETVYSLHSVSKQFTAAGILLLAEGGRVDLDAPIQRYLDEAGEAWKDVTVRHLLAHTSGIPDHLTVDLAVPDNAPDADKVRALAALPLKFSPGERWSYNNSGYLLAAEIIRRVSGQNTTDFLRDFVFQPLGMRTATAISKTHPVPGRAPKYVWKNGEWLNAEFPYDVYQIADSGMAASVLDLARWDAALDAGRILSATSRKAMWTSGRLNDGTPTGYGFGWFLNDVRGQRRVQHEGASFNGYRTVIHRYPERRLTVIVLCNGGQPNFNVLASGIAGLYDPALKPPFQMSAQTDPYPVRTQELVELLSGLARGETPESGLTLGLRNAIQRGHRSRPPAAYGSVLSMTYLGSDNLHRPTIVRYGHIAVKDIHVRITTKTGPSYVTFSVAEDGLLAGWRTYTPDD